MGKYEKKYFLESLKYDILNVFLKGDFRVKKPVLNPASSPGNFSLLDPEMFSVNVILLPTHSREIIYHLDNIHSVNKWCMSANNKLKLYWYLLSRL